MIARGTYGAPAAQRVALAEGPPDPQPHAKSAQRRQAFRVNVQFPVGVRGAKRGRAITIHGEARDLSISGMLVVLPTACTKGAQLELSFSLPYDPTQLRKTNEVIEITPFGPRRRWKMVPAKPFERIEAKARVVKTLRSVHGVTLFGLRFTSLSPRLKDELARWIHSQQLQQLRKIVS